MKVEERERGSIPKVKISYTPRLCVHCDDAPCIKAAEGNAIYKRADGIVIINPEKAIGQKQVVEACPYGAIYYNEELNIPQKCTMCAHLIDRGWKEPRCVEVCPTGALKFGEYDDLKNIIEKAEVLKPELGTKPRVYYLGLPKSFIAGALFDQKEDECVEGAIITATDQVTGKVYTTKSDNYGDFWLNDVEANHTYTVKIENPKYQTRTVEDIRTDKDVNLGDIELKQS
jgi:Fe-S-cluster-containing dehydrogenase component